MAILTRMVQLLKADIHAVMDQIEDQGLLLKQHLRDMEQFLVEKEAQLKKMRAARDRAQQEHQQAERETGNLEQDLQIAIEKNRDDIARMLIKKLKPLSRLQTARRNHIDRLNLEIDRFKALTEQQRIEYAHLRQKAAEYFYHRERKNWEPIGPAASSGLRIDELSEEEIELELLQRKEALKGGAIS
jgi:phage shock protein A